MADDLAKTAPVEPCSNWQRKGNTTDCANCGFGKFEHPPAATPRLISAREPEYWEDCPDTQLLPDGDTCPRCWGPRAPSGVDGGSWVHFPREARRGEASCCHVISDYGFIPDICTLPLGHEGKHHLFKPRTARERLQKPAAPPVAEGPAGGENCETPCSKSTDEQHCNCWYDGKQCCYCRDAAVGVAEGPAATPRPPIATDHCLQCGIHLAPDEELGGLCSRHKPSSNSVTFPAAAEPPEARAAARKWLDEHFQPHSQSGDYLRRDATDSAEYATWDLIAEYASDLQHQLDNWKVNARTAREYWRSASAANQELRSELACQWEANHAEHCGIWPHPDKDVCHWPKPAALLGPQHGQKESE